nr:protein FAR1-RELATED SEQUENCE 5-like [Ipomoea batatas]
MYVDQGFNILDEGVKFYRHYVGVVGFDVRQSIVKKSGNGDIALKYMVCGRVGFKSVVVLMPNIAFLHCSVLQNFLLGVGFNSRNLQLGIKPRWMTDAGGDRGADGDDIGSRIFGHGGSASISGSAPVFDSAADGNLDDDNPFSKE